MSFSDDYDILSASATDAPHIYRLIHELADYERLQHRVTATEADIRLALEKGQVEAVLVWHAGKPAGYALFYWTFSTFSGKPGLYIEDLYVCEGMRGRNIGKELFKCLSSKALEHGCDRMSWLVLDWNHLARSFYERMGARQNTPWHSYYIDQNTMGTLITMP